MTVDDRSRSDLLHRLDEVLGPEIAVILMDHLPPAGWRDVATVQDLDNQSIVLRAHIDGRTDVLRAEMAQLGSELRSDMAQLAGELRTEAAQLGVGLRSEMNQLRTEMNQLGGDVRTESASIRSDLEAKTDLLRAEITSSKLDTLATLRGELASQTRTLVLGLFAMFAGLAGVLVAVRPG